MAPDFSSIWVSFVGIWVGLYGDLGTSVVSGLGAVGIWVGTAAFRAPAGARTLLGIWVALSWLGTFRVSGLGVVGIWVGSAAFRGDKTRHAAGGLIMPGG